MPAWHRSGEREEERAGGRCVRESAARRSTSSELGPVRDELLRRAGRPRRHDAVVVDPAAARLRLRDRALGAALRRHPRHAWRTATTSAAWPTSRGTGAPGHMPAGERRASSAPMIHTQPAVARPRPYEPEHTSRGRGELELAGIRSRPRTSPATRPATSPSPPTARSSRATCCSPAPSAAPISPTPTGTRCSPPSAASSSAFRPRRSSTRATGRRRRSGDELAAIRSWRSFEPSGGEVRGAAAARTTSSRQKAALAAGRSARSSVCARSTATARSTTPVFEDTELFARTSGAGSDVVQKEMYTFEDRGGRSLTLRPEATAPIVRAYVQHGMHREPQPVKLYTVAPMCRYAAPQRGRYREHWQLSVEAIGSDDPAIDAELIQLYADLLGRLGVTRLRASSSTRSATGTAGPATSSGWRLARRARGRARRRGAPEARDLSAPGLRHEERAARGALADAPTIGESLCAACQEHFDAVRGYLDAFGVPTTRADARPRSRLLHADDLGVRRTKRSAPSARSAAVGATTTSSRRWVASTTPGIGFGAGIERLLLSPGLTPCRRHHGIDVFFVLEEVRIVRLRSRQ